MKKSIFWYYQGPHTIPYIWTFFRYFQRPNLIFSDIFKNLTHDYKRVFSDIFKDLINVYYPGIFSYFRGPRTVYFLIDVQSLIPVTWLFYRYFQVTHSSLQTWSFLDIFQDLDNVYKFVFFFRYFQRPHPNILTWIFRYYQGPHPSL